MPHLAARIQKEKEPKPSLKAAFHVDNKPTQPPLHQRFLAHRNKSPSPQLQLPGLEHDFDNIADDEEEESSSSNPSYEENQRRIFI